jgi:hypothetical protein
MARVRQRHLVVAGVSLAGAALAASLLLAGPASASSSPHVSRPPSASFGRAIKMSSSLSGG